MNLPKHTQAFAHLVAAYPRWDVDKAVTAVWLRDLEPYVEDDVERVFTDWRRNRVWPPSIAEVLRALHGIPDVASAWAEVVACAAKESQFKRVTGSSLVMAAAQRIWPDRWLPDNGLRMRREFEQAYERVVAERLGVAHHALIGDGQIDDGSDDSR